MKAKTGTDRRQDDDREKNYTKEKWRAVVMRQIENGYFLVSELLTPQGMEPQVVK